MRINIRLILLLAAIDRVCGCLTWELAGHLIRFICRTADDSMSVHLVDNYENDVSRCTLNGSSSSCSSFKFVKAIVQENLVTYYVDINMRKKAVNGNWTCLQEDHKFMSEVSTSKDLAEITTINLFGKIVEDDDVQRILLTCSSCRIPKGKNAEFLMDNSSVDSITFNDETGKCSHLHGECTPSKCYCSHPGNTFFRIILLERSLVTDKYFSCDMIFEDKVKSVVFSKVATVHFNGREFKDRGTRTVITILTDDHKYQKDKDGDTVEVVLVVIGVLTVVAITSILGVRVFRLYLHRKRKKKNQNKKKENVADYKNVETNQNKKKENDADYRNVETNQNKKKENDADYRNVEMNDVKTRNEEPIQSNGNTVQCENHRKESRPRTYVTRELCHVQPVRHSGNGLRYNFLHDVEPYTNIDQQILISFTFNEEETDDDRSYKSYDD